MRLLFSKSASPHHGFAAYYTYLEKIFGVGLGFRSSACIFSCLSLLNDSSPAGCPVPGGQPLAGVHAERPRPAKPATNNPCPPLTTPPQADAVLHFGTHGSLEFMPGKQVRHSGPQSGPQQRSAVAALDTHLAGGLALP